MIDDGAANRPTLKMDYNTGLIREATPQEAADIRAMLMYRQCVEETENEFIARLTGSTKRRV